MPSKKARAKAKKVAAARAPPAVPVKALAGPGQDDLARSKKADLRAARRLARNYGNGSDTVSTLDDGRRRAMMEALTQGQATEVEHHTSKFKQPIATQDRLRRKLAVRRGEWADGCRRPLLLIVRGYLWLVVCHCWCGGRAAVRWYDRLLVIVGGVLDLSVTAPEAEAQ